MLSEAPNCYAAIGNIKKDGIAMRVVIHFLCLALVFSSCTPLVDQGIEQPNLEVRIEELITRYVDMGEFSGSILVADGNQIIFRRGYGFSNQEEQTLNAPDTQFHIQSVAKLFTYAAVLMETKAGHLSFSDPIEQYFPGFPNGDRITVGHLLYHRSGLIHYPHDVPGHIVGAFSSPTDLDVIIEELKSYPLKFEPGEQFGYSNAGYSMLAGIIEDASSSTFADYLEDKIFTPSAMNQTTANWDAISLDHATGYVKVDGQFIPSSSDHPSHYVGAGTVYSTVDDMYRWYQASYINGSMAEYSSGGGDGRGMGYRAIFWPIPSFDFVIIILSNYMDAPLHEIVGEVAGILLEDTAFLDIKQEHVVKLVGQFEANTGYGDYKFSIYESTGKLFVSINDFQSGLSIYELRPISDSSYAFLVDGRITGQTLKVTDEDDVRVLNLAVDLSIMVLDAKRSD
jgi:CubicO group peptidase (beta-lactamase class C family)